ncbi:modF [Symbiodinium sp. KB8]|nr:modF [Symbiodinium sp. KB8]
MATSSHSRDPTPRGMAPSLTPGTDENHLKISLFTLGTAREQSLGQRPSIGDPSQTTLRSAEVGGATLIEGLDLTVQSGERWALVGPNGSGKSRVAQALTETWAVAAGPSSAGHVSFDLQTKMLQDERRDFEESRYETRHLRATVASYLFPDCYPADPDYDPATWGYRPPRTRVSPLPAPYDASSSHPLLGELEAASTRGEAARLLKLFGLFELRHRPLFALSTGEGRKLLLVDALLQQSSLLVLDEAFDGLDKDSRAELQRVLEAVFEDKSKTLVMIAHRVEDLTPVPTHALLLGQGPKGTACSAGSWAEMKEPVSRFLQADRIAAASLASGSSQPSSRPATPEERGQLGEVLVEFRNVTIQYGPIFVFKKLNWTVRQSEKWIVVGGNGTGKTTLVDLITGENVQGYQQDIHLFGRQKGSGESVWEIKKQLGVISSELHMEYMIFSDPRFDRKVTAWEVVCSGLFDSIGLYVEPTSVQRTAVLEWIDKLGLQELVISPSCDKALAALAPFSSSPMFFDLSHGQQKLVLLCRAMVKEPRLLLLDEPTHGLSGSNRAKFLSLLQRLAQSSDVAIILVTHREDEIRSLGFPNVLRLRRDQEGQEDSSSAQHLLWRHCDSCTELVPPSKLFPVLRGSLRCAAELEAMGAKCSEMMTGTPSQVKPSEALLEEDEDDGEDEEAEEEEDEEDEEASVKADAEKALKGGLMRGKTAAFEEAIEHATSVGIDETMIAHAEKKLQQHKVQREREVFIEELPKFLGSEDADDEAKCEEQIEVGKKHGVPESHLQQLRQRIEFIKLGRDLEEEELTKAQEMTTESTRRFVTSCFAGRSLMHIDPKGKKVKVLCKLDPAMRKLRIEEEAGAEVCSAELVKVQACAGPLAELGESSPLTSLSDEEQDRSIALRAGGEGPWLFLEQRPELHAEFLLALAVLGSGNGETKVASTTSMKSRCDEFGERGSERDLCVDRESEAGALLYGGSLVLSLDGNDLEAQVPDTSPGLVPPGLPPRGAVAMDLSRHVSGDLWVVRLDKLSDHQGEASVAALGLQQAFDNLIPAQPFEWPLVLCGGRKTETPCLPMVSMLAPARAAFSRMPQVRLSIFLDDRTLVHPDPDVLLVVDEARLQGECGQEGHHAQRNRSPFLVAIFVVGGIARLSPKLSVNVWLGGGIKEIPISKEVGMLT